MNHAAAQSLESKLATFARARLLNGPTPLDQLHHLGGRLGVSFWLKRDDLTPIALGGG